MSGGRFAHEGRGTEPPGGVPPGGGGPSPAADPRAPYVRLAVVALIRRAGGIARSEGLGGYGEARLGGGAEGGDVIGGGAAERGTAGQGAVTGRAGSADRATWLLLHRKEPVDAWDPPGGRMEEGEDLGSAVLREVSEETGLTVEVAGPCYSFLTVYKDERLLAVSMACRPVGDADGIRLEPDGADAWRWVTA
ncbi:MAG: NUDIX hydrolase, partial [Actinomycetia bacterium]|nr:NUDIX hydrolase [Actinomycetes bacterium]